MTAPLARGDTDVNDPIAGTVTTPTDGVSSAGELERCRRGAGTVRGWHLPWRERTVMGVVAALLVVAGCSSADDNSSSIESDATEDHGSDISPTSRLATTVPTTTDPAPTAPSTTEPPTTSAAPTTNEAFTMTPALAQEIADAYLRAGELLDAARGDLSNLEAREAALAAWTGIEREWHTLLFDEIESGAANVFVSPDSAPVRVVESEPMLLDNPPSSVTGVLSRAGEIGPATSIAGFVVCENVTWFPVWVDDPQPAPGELISPEVVRSNAYAAVIEGEWKVFLLDPIVLDLDGTFASVEPLAPVDDPAAPCVSS
jgi:hypothetical protein